MHSLADKGSVPEGAAPPPAGSTQFQATIGARKPRGAGKKKGLASFIDGACTTEALRERSELVDTVKDCTRCAAEVMDWGGQHVQVVCSHLPLKTAEGNRQSNLLNTLGTVTTLPNDPDIAQIVAGDFNVELTEDLCHRAAEIGWHFCDGEQLHRRKGLPIDGLFYRGIPDKSICVVKLTEELVGRIWSQAVIDAYDPQKTPGAHMPYMYSISLPTEDGLRLHTIRATPHYAQTMVKTDKHNDEILLAPESSRQEAAARSISASPVSRLSSGHRHLAVDAAAAAAAALDCDSRITLE